jgi:Family of unknown function (DUF6082)
VSQRWWRTLLLTAVTVLSLALVTASIAVPIILLLSADDRTLNRWAAIGQALSPVGIFFSGIAFIAIAVTLFLQGRQLRHQREELNITQEEQKRNSEIVLRQLHNDLIKMAIDDPDLLAVWPPIAPGVAETKRDHYCNLILNMQKVAYETQTIELAELRGALDYLMRSRDVYLFWAKARAARIEVTGGDAAEGFFTSEADRAYAEAPPPKPRHMGSIFRQAAGQWLAERRSRRRA